MFVLFKIQGAIYNYLLTLRIHPLFIFLLKFEIVDMLSIDLSSCKPSGRESLVLIIISIPLESKNFYTYYSVHFLLL
jgi:hypothetical protein